MPAISNRGSKVPASPIRKLVPFAEEAKRKGRKIYQLNIGQPDIPTPASALDAVRNIDFDVLPYIHSAGFESYRRKLAESYKSQGMDVEYTDIITTTGASESILFTMMSCLDAGDEVIVPEPFYANYNGFTLAGDVAIRPITSYIEDNFALPAIAEFEKLVTSKTKAILICNPSNPTGYMYSKEELLALRDLVKKHNLFLFVDEVYRDFCYDGRQFTSVLTLEGLDEHVVVFDSVSKRFSACGARVGALISRNKDIVGTAMKFAQARLSPPTLGQIVAEATLDVEADYLEAAKAEYDSRRQLIVQRLQAMEGVVCPNPGGAFYAFVKLPIDDSEKFCQWLLEDFEHNGETLMMAPGSGFYSTQGLGTQEVRIAYVLNNKDLSSALDCLEKALEVYPGRVSNPTQSKIMV